MLEAPESGKIRYRATLQNFVVTSTGDRGQPIGTWQTFLDPVWIGLEDLAGRQLEISRQLVAKATHKITMRFYPGVLPGMRVLYNGRTFAIGHVGEADFRRFKFDLVVTEQKTGAT